MPYCIVKLHTKKIILLSTSPIYLTKAAPHSPRRQKLNLRMKSLSLDSPESSELHGQMRRRYPPAGPSSHYPGGGSGGALEHTPPSNNSRLHCKYICK